MSLPRPAPLLLAVETSCDDTACAVLDGDGCVLASVVSSQLAAHQPYGGVVPEIASREHLRNWPATSANALAAAGVGVGEIDAVAATRGPGLVGSLLVGLSLGKALAYALDRPFYAVHHLEGHLFSPFLRRNGEPAVPIPEHFVGLVVSGGHTALFGVEHGVATQLAATRDDAMGEAFDKVGKRLGLPFPAGPVVDQLADTADTVDTGSTGNTVGTVANGRYRFKTARCGTALDFSYSGLKTQTLRALERLEQAGGDLDFSAGRRGSDEALEVLAAFRASAVAQLVDRLERLRRVRRFDCLAVSGGVAANRLLRRRLGEWAARRGVDLALVPLEYSGDNAAMIAHAALLRHRRGLADDPRSIDAESRLPLG